MNKILLIIRREYLSRVKKKSFIVLTILVPVLMIGMYALIGYLAVKGDNFAETKKIAVIDESGTFEGKLKNTGSIEYSFITADYAKEKTKYMDDGYNYLLHVPAPLTGIELLSDKKPSAMTLSNIEDALTDIASAQRLKAAGIDTAILAKAQQHLTVSARHMGERGEEDAHVLATSGIGFLSALLIYLCLFIYGAQVMRGVIEEKVSRIIEVIISSVKPFQLMLGKIIGVGMVGLTQFVLWIVLSLVLSAGAGPLLQKGMKQRTEMAAKISNAQTGSAQAAQPAPPSEIRKAIDSIPITKIALCFLFYFFTGYLFYSAIFAAVGSAVDNETETQQFMLPITLPLVFTFMLSYSFIINNPDSPLAVWLSMIPITSPIAMMMRIPFGVPGWQLALSMFLMIVGFLFNTWVASRIYRVGILMYGKKATYRELAKWFMYKE